MNMRESANQVTNHCTTDLLEELRYFRGIKLVATEVKHNNTIADVLTINVRDQVYEFEVKISESDFMHDFRKTIGLKKYGKSRLKHASYTDPEDNTFAPHLFTYVVPLEMEAFVLEQLADYPRYGLWVWDPSVIIKKGNRGKSTTSRFREAKAARKIIKGKRNAATIENLKTKIINRATSSTVLLRKRLIEAENKRLARVQQDEVDSIVYLLFKKVKNEDFAWHTHEDGKSLETYLGDGKLFLKKINNAIELQTSTRVLMSSADELGELSRSMFEAMVTKAQYQHQQNGALWGNKRAKNRSLGTNKNILKLLKQKKK